MASYNSPYEEFNKIIQRNYTPREVDLMNDAADDAFYELDRESADNLGWSTDSNRWIPDQDDDFPFDWDNPHPLEPPELF